MYFRSYRHENMHLDKSLKSAVSQYPSTSNMVKSLKHVSNHDGGTFIILIDHQ